MNKTIERDIMKIYSKVFNEIYNKTNMAALAQHANRTNILRKAEIIENSDAYDKFAQKFAAELAKKGLTNKRGVWRKYFQAAQKFHYVGLPKTWQAFEMQQLSKAVKHNYTMIKSIPQATLSLLEHKYTSTLIEEVAKGKLSRGSFQRQLASHGHKNAKLIARTETAKLQTAITENRSKDLGAVVYEWVSSNDKRTRPSHRAMDGVIVFWRDGFEKPKLDEMYGNPGEFPNCRCDAQPIFDESDLTKDRYKVYDYKEHKIISMTKKELIKHIQEGSL